MPRTFTTSTIQDINIEQIVITNTKDTLGNPVVRVRSSANVVLVDSIDPTKNQMLMVNLNKTTTELNPSIAAHITAIKNIVLKELQDQIA